MNEKKPPVTDSIEDTDSIDVSTLLTENVTFSGSFDVKQFRTTSFGKLLQALPVPALLIDESHGIVFANRMSTKIDPDDNALVGSPISVMCPDHNVAEIVRSCVESVFATRVPYQCEAALGVGRIRIWGRLFFRSVRLEEKRMILLVVEDFTVEKKQLILRKRAEEALEKANRELEDRIERRTQELLTLNETLEQEIRERERAQKLLIESQQRLELALKGADLGLWDYDVRANVAFVDKTWADLFGYSLEEMQPSLTSWRNMLHPEDRPAVVDAWNAHLEGRTAMYEAEHRVKAKSGEWNWVLSRGKVVERGEDGKPLRVSGTAFNVTDRKRAEEKLLQMSKVFMESIDPIFIRDLEGRLIDLNRAAEETCGSHRDELIGNPIETTLSTTRAGILDHLLKQCKRGEKVENVEALLRKKSGEVIPVLLSLSVLRNNRGEPVGIASITKDLSYLKKTEEMLRAKTAALERSNRDLEEFASVAAHDLREPLVGIAAYLKILKKRSHTSVDSEANTFVSRALEIALRMDTLVQSLLSYSRLGTEPQLLEHIDCNVVLERALSNLGSSIHESRAAITSDPLPTVMGNLSQMIQLFQNLLSNALKFADDRPLEIHIGVTRQQSGWLFSVKDNGIGMETHDFQRIFRIFQRLEGGRERPGTGIGLANCKKIVEHHGGRIWVESEPGKGSTFFFTIPDPAGTY
ncbi:MAG TPA: PAS domain S-box protein [Desulfomonilaceae bacterium]|nr:PAS domain S-box protein [Desulfomonilaceae bacterium]